MRNLNQGSVFTQSNGDRFCITRVVDDNRVFAIWIGNNSFTDRTTFNGFMRNGDFRTDNILFRRTKNGFRRIQAIGGMFGLMINQDSQNIFDLLD